MDIELNVQLRNIVGKNVVNLREQGFIPAVMYGPDTESVNLKVQKGEFTKFYEKAGHSRIIHLNINEGKSDADVLIQEVVKDPVTNFISHIDFYKFKAGQKMNATIEIKYIGEPRTVKELGAILVKSMYEIEVRCLPKDLISEVEVDLTKIQKVEDVIKISDLKLPETIEILHSKDDLIALTNIQREEKQEEVEQAPAEAEDVAAKADDKEKKEEVKK